MIEPLFHIPAPINTLMHVVYYLTKHLHAHEMQPGDQYYRCPEHNTLQQKKRILFYLKCITAQYRQLTNYFNSIWDKILNKNERTHLQCLFPYG